MEYIIFFGSFTVLCIAVTVREIISANQAKKKLMAYFKDTFGKHPTPVKPERWEFLQGYYKNHQSDKHLDDITWNDLEMDKFFASIHFTQSSLGEEYLYAMLRNCNLSLEEGKDFDKLCEYLTKEEHTRCSLQVIYKSIGNTGKFSIYDYLNHLGELGKRSSLLSIVTDGCILISLCCMPFFFYPAIAIFAFLLVLNIVTYFKEKNTLSLYVNSFLFVIRTIVYGEKIQKLEISQLPQKEELDRLLHQLKPMTRGMGMVAKINTPITGSNPLDLIADYIKMAFHVDLLLFHRMYKLLQNKESDLDKLIGILGKLEAAIAVANFRKSLSYGYCLPTFSQTRADGISIQDGYHPLIEHAVTNSIDTKNGVLITGSNASGKSSFLKMVALNAVLAQSIYTVAAKAFTCFPCRIYSSMSLRDNLEEKDSYFLVEIKAMKRILDAGNRGESILCFVDEVLRGTNTVERIAASTQILKTLNNVSILPFAATHDIELTYLLEQSFENYHFEESIQGEDVVFTYLLKEGRANSRNAILLLNGMGYDKSLTAQASKLVDTFERTGKWMEE